MVGLLVLVPLLISDRRRRGDAVIDRRARPRTTRGLAAGATRDCRASAAGEPGGGTGRGEGPGDEAMKAVMPGRRGQCSVMANVSASNAAIPEISVEVLEPGADEQAAKERCGSMTRSTDALMLVIGSPTRC